MSRPTPDPGSFGEVPTLRPAPSDPPAAPGAIAIAMVLARNGLWLTPAEIAHLLPPGPSQPTSLAAAARRMGLLGDPVTLPATAIATVTPPALIDRDGATAVFEAVEPGGIRINDPHAGSHLVSPETFARGFAGWALPLRPAPGFDAGLPHRTTLRDLATHIRPARPALAIVAAIVLIQVVPGFILPAAVELVIDQVLTKRFADWIFWLFTALLASAIIIGALNALQETFLRRAQAAIGTTLTSTLFWRLLNVPASYYAKVSAGGALQRLDAAGQLAQTVAETVGRSMTSLVLLVFYGALMFAYSIPLAAACVLLTAANVLATGAVGRRRQTLLTAQQRQSAALIGTSVHGLQAIETLKSMATEAFFFRRWSDANAALVQGQQRIDALSIRLTLAPQILAVTAAAITLGYGATLVIGGQLTIGSLIAFQMLLARFTRPANELIVASQRLQQLSAQLQRVDQLLHTRTDPAVRPRPCPPGAPKLSGAIELRRVSFGYDPAKPPLIRAFDLVLRPGARIALVGGSGSGKSTIGKLVVGLLQPTAGEILFDGRPAVHYPRPVLASSIGYVDQDIRLFAGTVRDCLTLEDQTIPLPVIRQAAIDACIDDNLTARPGGYDSLVAENGANFSGGQQQRIEIARALAPEPTILVMDEATAALDSETERRIDENLRRRGCTCLIIAHRLSTIRDADEIIVMDRGQVVERGTHTKLMAAHGRYAELVAEAG